LPTSPNDNCSAASRVSANRRRFLSEIAIPTGALVLGMVGCEQPRDADRSSRTRRPRVVATTGMIADLVDAMGGDRIELIPLIGAGVDPHLYKPLRDDVVRVLDADLVFYNGLFLEGRMSELFAQAASPSRLVIAVADGTPESSWLGKPGTDAADPHLWMDVSLWSMATNLVQDALLRLLPGDEAWLRQRGDELRNRLAALDRRGLEALRSIPQSQRVLITSHDAFQYFGRRYGIEVQGVQGISTTSEAGLKRIPELIDLIIARSIPAVFRESSVAGKLISAMVEGAAARGYQLRLGGELYSDALGPRGSGADSYIGMMEHNFRTIASALGGRWGDSKG
jgi:manganese/zinc/iron transport system substrate-binding protein